jgi:hypothetical protein
LNHEVQSGFLRSKGEIHYEYQYINGECKIRAWNKDYLNLPDFEQIDFVMEMLVD